MYVCSSVVVRAAEVSAKGGGNQREEGSEDNVTISTIGVKRALGVTQTIFEERQTGLNLLPLSLAMLFFLVLDCRV